MKSRTTFAADARRRVDRPSAGHGPRKAIRSSLRWHSIAFRPEAGQARSSRLFGQGPFVGFG